VFTKRKEKRVAKRTITRAETNPRFSVKTLMGDVNHGGRAERTIKTIKNGCSPIIIQND